MQAQFPTSWLSSGVPSIRVKRVTDEHRYSKSGDGKPQLSGGLVTLDQTGPHDDSGCYREEIPHTEQRRLLEGRDQLDDVDHGKAHERYHPSRSQDGRGDRLRRRVIERRGRLSVGGLMAPRKDLHGHVVSLRE
jgi:hypothetical protein